MIRWRTKTYSVALEPGPASKRLDDSDTAAAYCRAILEQEDQDREHFVVVVLDARGAPIAHKVIATGSVAACLVSPRQVFQPAMVDVAAHSILVAHNHPSGDRDASSEDVVLTERLVECGQILGLPLVDSLVITRDGHSSVLAECCPRGGRVSQRAADRRPIR